MKKAGFLTLFLLLACITQAELVDDFESYTVGSYSGGSTAFAANGGPWQSNTGGATGLVSIENDGDNYLAFGWNSGARGANRTVPTIAEGSSGTYYFQMSTTDATPDFSAGLSDQPTGGLNLFGDFEVQVAMTYNAATGIRLGARNGGATSLDLVTGLSTNTWYDIWVVVDNAADTYDVYFGTGLGPDNMSSASLIADDFGFRNGTASNDLVTFMTLSNFHEDNNANVDNIYTVSANAPYSPALQQTPNAPHVDVILTWKAGKDPGKIFDVNPDIVDEYIFMRNEADSDPNLYYVGATGIDPGNDPDSQFGPVSLIPGQTYKWAVVEAIDGYEQTFTVDNTLNDVDGDPNNIIGPAWRFTTNLLVPDFETHPADQFVFPGDPAEFTVVLKDATDTSYQWYKDGDPILDATFATLAIANAQNADEGVYFCTATNSSGSTDSLTAKLQIKRLRSHYRFESMTDSITPDEIDGFDMTLTSEDAGATGLPSLQTNVANPALGTYSLLLDNGDHAADPNGMYGQIAAGAVDYEDLTITAWVYWNGGANWQRLFDFGNDTSHYVFLTPSHGSECRFVLNNGGGEQLVSTTPLATGEWVFIAATLGGDTGRLYLNGEQQAENTGMTINPDDFNPTLNYIGKSQWPDPEFDGMIDDMKIYNYALDAQAIAAAYYQATGLQACYDPAFAGNAYNLDNTGSSYCKVDLADFAVFAANWLADGLWMAP